MAGWIESISRVSRPHLGNKVPVFVFRAFRVLTGVYLEDTVGHRGAITLLQNAGRELGKKIGQNLRDERFDAYIGKIIDFVRDAKIGLLVPVEVNQDSVVLDVAECITCAGMPNIGKKICHFEGGFIADVVEAYTGKKVRVYQTKAHSNGDGICEFVVELNYA